MPGKEPFVKQLALFVKKNMSKFTKKQKLMLTNFFKDWLKDRKKKLASLVNYVCVIVGIIINKLDKINKVRKKKYSWKHIKYFAIMKLFIHPKRNTEIILMKILKELVYIKKASNVHRNFTDYYKFIKKIVRGEGEYKTDKQKRRFVVRSIKRFEEERFLFNYYFFYFFYNVGYYFILSGLIILLCVIFYITYYFNDIFY